MTNQEILTHVDHTQLKAFAVWEDIQQLCEEAIRFQTASVCIPPTYIKKVKDTFGEQVTICTVVGFPLGYSVTAAKITEVEQALIDGADEIDMVVNIAHVKNGWFDLVEAEIHALKEACKGKILKVIIETCYLSEEEKIKMCHIVSRVGADFIKTSTGFGTGGATREDITLMKENCSSSVRIKAAGGVKTRQDMEDFLGLSCERIGTSSAIGILQGEETKGY